MKTLAAIVGPGNIGTDLMAKLQRSDVLEVALHGRRRPDVRRPGPRPRARARGLGRGRGLAAAPRTSCRDSSSRPPRPRRTWPTPRATPRPGIHGRRPHARPPSGRSSARRSTCDVAPRRAERQHDHLRRPGDDPDGARRLVASSRCRTPRSSPRSPPARPGPGTRANIDEFTETTVAAPSRASAAPQRGKAIIILNPVEPPMIMRDTVFCAIRRRRRPATRSPSRSTRWSPRCSSTCPATRCAPSRSSTTPRDVLAGQRPGRGRSSRSRATATTCPTYAGQPRHHDRRRRPVGELIGAAASAERDA